MSQSDNKPLDKPFCNKSYNSYKHSVTAIEENCSRLERKIIEVLETEERKLGPKEIQTLLASEKYGKFAIKGGSLRPLLKRLHLKGLIVCYERGFYCSWRTYEVRLKPLRVHNVRISCELTEKLDSWEFEKKIGGVRVYVCFGSERSKITGGLYCDEGMDRNTCMFGLDKWANIAKEHLGRELPYFNVVSLHVNRDEFNAEFDGSLHCATRDILKNQILERVYEKKECLRQELVVKRQLTPQEVEETIFNTGMKGFVSNTTSFENERRLSHIEASTKSANQKLIDVSQSLIVVSNTLIRKAEGEDSLVKTVSEMKAQISVVLEQLASKTLESEQLKQICISQAELVLRLEKSNSELTGAVSSLLKALNHSQQREGSEKNVVSGEGNKPIPDFYTR